MYQKQKKMRKNIAVWKKNSNFTPQTPSNLGQNRLVAGQAEVCWICVLLLINKPKASLATDYLCEYNNVIRTNQKNNKHYD